MKTKTKLDHFHVRSGSLTFGDPCYSSNKSVKAQNGKWTARAEFTARDSWGSRVSRLTVHRVNFNPADPRIVVKTKGFSVDSGQAGVFDAGGYGTGFVEGFYDACCRETLSDSQWGFVSSGAVSSSGYGDGFYDAKIHLVDGEAVCIELEFIEN